MGASSPEIRISYLLCDSIYITYTTPITKIPVLGPYLLALFVCVWGGAGCGVPTFPKTLLWSHCVLQVCHHFSQMSSGGGWHTGCCSYPCDVQCPQPLATACNDPCVVSCAASRVIIFPPPVVVTFPGPILSTCPQETVVGSSAISQGCAPASLTSLGAEILHSGPSAGRFIPSYLPQCASRCSYVFSSHWIHPCNRPSYRRYRPPDREREEHIPVKEKPETETTNAANEEKETSEA